MSIKVTIVGFGTMGKAIAKEISKKDRQIKIFSIDIDKNIKDDFVRASNFIILSVKPQDAPLAIGQIKKNISNKTILISIMAGFPIKRLLALSGHKKIIRMMPNLGLAIGAGIAVWRATGLSKIEIKKAKSFMDKITENFEVKNEDTIDKVTAISANGPAYFFLLASHLIGAGESLGLTKNESQKLVEKTFSAAAILGKDSDYSMLVKKVASKGGTTEAALKVFKVENFGRIVSKAVEAGYKRAKQLSHAK
jgi:pyrroline-5-carboxylate reductase